MDRGHDRAEGDRNKTHCHGAHRPFDHCEDEEGKSRDDDRHTRDSGYPKYDFYIGSFQPCDDAAHVSLRFVIGQRTPSFVGEVRPADSRAASAAARGRL